jgi:dTDP-glucose pyrophosphorylase
MTDWKKTVLDQKTSIHKVIETIENTSMQIALIVDEKGQLVGTVTDGDIRRGILKGIPLDDPVQKVMKTDPVVVRENESREAVLSIIKHRQIYSIPIVDENRCPVGLASLNKLLLSGERENWVVLMAGGLGSRLKPMTDECPKPLLKIGNKPILENILQNFIENGFTRFYISVNYMSDMVEEYFGDGSRWGVEIKYLYEDKKLGTAGAISLIKEKHSEPIFIMNGDLLTKVNFLQMLDFHIEHKADVTMGIREFDFQVPYGVVKRDDYRFVDIIEKPVQKLFINAGIYVLNPELLKMIPENSFYEMPNLLKYFKDQNKEIIVFPVREYWLDIGHIDDYRQANEYIKIINE